MFTKLIKSLGLAAMLAVGFAASPAFAQDDPDDGDNPLDTPTESSKDEHTDLATGSDTAKPDLGTPDEKGHRTIKTLQHKTFLKLGRYEASPHIGFVTNDPFINRYLIGAAFAYHVTEIFAIEAVGTFSPDFGHGDWKGITHQLVEQNRVSPDISKILYFGNLNFQFSPIYGKVAVGRKIINFDIFGTFGTGVVSTKDDLDALQCPQDQSCIDTESQIHPTTNFGGGFRVIFNRNLAARLEGRSMIYIETIDSTTLEMKNNFMLLGSVSIFFPNME